MQGHLVIDLQYGSTGKGLICGKLAQIHRPDTVVSAWAANAGHTFVDTLSPWTVGSSDGAVGNFTQRKYVHTMVPNGVISQNLRRILLGPGSLIDPKNLIKELDSVRDHLHHTKPDILIHPHAAIITDAHREAEQGPMTKIGSTKKGVGEAMIERIRRDPDRCNIASRLLAGWPELLPYLATVEQYNNALDAADQILIEGAQGFSLSMYHGFYPYCTSRDVTVAQIVADCGIPLGYMRGITVVGTIRSFPIRVANRHNEVGEQVGWSGPHYPDQFEMDWERDFGMKPELTTVTKLPRRIFSFSPTQLRQALRMNSVNCLFVNFVNYLKTPGDALGFLSQVHSIASENGTDIAYVGMGATADDVWPMANHRTGAFFEQFLPGTDHIKQQMESSNFTRWINRYYQRAAENKVLV